MTPTPRFRGLINELANACTPTSATNASETSDQPNILIQRVLETWNQTRSTGNSTRTTPKPSTATLEDAEDNMIKVTLMFELLEANAIDDLFGGRKIIYMPRVQLERVLGPMTTKAKISEIRKGEVYLADVLPTTFHAISQWLNGKAILHTIPREMRGKALFELVQIYILAARLGHRSIVHDSTNNMPLTDTPFTFLETCAIIYTKGCAGVAFRNFFRKGLPIVLKNSKFDQTNQVGRVLERSSELATDFAEVMLGIMRQDEDDNSELNSSAPAPEPFPSFQATSQQDRWAHFCSCGRHECTCTEDSISIMRPSDTHTIPRRSGYVETAPPSEAGEEHWAGPGPWVQHDGTAGWDYSHRPVPSGSDIPGPVMSAQDAENQPFHPRNWSSAHLGHDHFWENANGETESIVDGWDRPDSPHSADWAPATSHQAPHAGRRKSRPQCHALIPVDSAARHAADLEARLRHVEQRLEQAGLASVTPPVRQTNSTVGQEAASSTQKARKATATAAVANRRALATSNFPPAPLLHPGVPPIGMPHYIPGYGYNRYVQVGNGVVHPTGPGPYGLAGRSMLALRNSDAWNCTLNFRAGDVIECVVPCEEGRSSVQHQPWNFTGQRLQGLCRTQAGSFPADYVREMYGDATMPGVLNVDNIPPSATINAGPSISTALEKLAQAKSSAQQETALSTSPAHPLNSATAGNVDNSWLQAAAPNGDHATLTQPAISPVAANQPPRARRSSSVTTTIRHKHLPGCPAELANWASCACPRPTPKNNPDPHRSGPQIGTQQAQQKSQRCSPGYDIKSSWDADGNDGYDRASDEDSNWSESGGGLW